MNSLCVVRPIQFIFTIINSLKGILVSHHIFFAIQFNRWGYVASDSPSSWSLPLVKAREPSWTTSGSLTLFDAGDPPLNMRRLWQEMRPATLPNTSLGEVKGREYPDQIMDHIGYLMWQNMHEWSWNIMNDIAYGIISLMSLDQGEIMLNHRSP